MKILIVEDDMYTRAGLAEIFESEGYEVVQAADGKSAIEMFSVTAPDIVCLMRF